MLFLDDGKDWGETSTSQNIKDFDLIICSIEYGKFEMQVDTI